MEDDSKKTESFTYNEGWYTCRLTEALKTRRRPSWGQNRQNPNMNMRKETHGVTPNQETIFNWERENLFSPMGCHWVYTL